MAIVDQRIEEAQNDFEVLAKEIASDTFEAISEITRAGHEKRTRALEDCVRSVLN